MDRAQLLSKALDIGRKYTQFGETAQYIPELACKDPSRIGIALCELDGTILGAGDWTDNFAIQSISKVMTLILAIDQNGMDYVFEKVGTEPTGDAFNSMVRLDQLTNNKPFNPMINAGAIAVASCIRGKDLEDRKRTGLEFARLLMGNPDLGFDQRVFESERKTGYRNRAIINLMKSNGIIDGEVDSHLDLYFFLCSICANCRDLAYFAAILSNNGRDCKSGRQVIPLRVLKLVRSLMVTCGMYDYSGEFAATVGVPAKSGVGGGIIAAPIGKCGLAVYGPALDAKGNSVGGIKMLEFLSETLSLNMF